MATRKDPSYVKKEVTRGATDYMRYMGLGLTMAGMILGATLLGWWLDGLVKWQFPALTLLFSLAGIAGAMFHLFKETGRK
jgi:hypothetical protein